MKTTECIKQDEGYLDINHGSGLGSNHGSGSGIKATDDYEGF